MGGKKSGRRGRARQAEGLFDISTCGGARTSRAGLLAGASLVALATLGEPGSAWASCSGAGHTISSPSFPGPVFGTGGDITVDAGASVAGGPTGVYAQDCGIGVLSNSGAIDGAAGASGGPGGIGVRANSGQTMDLLTNATGATISGGGGGSGPSGGTAAAGGVGVAIFGAVTTLTNSWRHQRGSRRTRRRRAPTRAWAAQAARACRTPARSRR